MGATGTLPSPGPGSEGRTLLTRPVAPFNDNNDNNDDTFDNGSHIKIDVTDVINVIPRRTVPQFSLHHRGDPGVSPSQHASGWPPARFSEVGGLPDAMLAI